MPFQKHLKYVIHRHDASHLHYDLRLEYGGALKSWAVPKEPSADPKVKRLAVQVADHALDYADFEGVIDEGRYGAGEVKIWDSGTYTPIKTEAKEWVVDIKGNKLNGIYCLIRLKDGKNWLFFKKKN